MPKTPFFSIITPSYQSEKTITETIKSVLNQNFNDYEYIIVDGGSSDNTVSIIESFAQDFKNKGIHYQYFSEKDKGIYDGWNKGVAISNGKWVSFLGSDDEYLPDALQNYFDEIQKSPSINYISSNVEIVNSERKKIGIFGKPFKWDKIIRNMTFAQVGSFHKKDLLQDVGPFSLQYSIVGDLDFYLRSKGKINAAYLNAVTAKMMNNGVSNSIYPALKQALIVKLKHRHTSKISSYYDFYLSLAKCYIKKAFGLM